MPVSGSCFSIINSQGTFQSHGLSVSVWGAVGPMPAAIIEDRYGIG
jgi:hypothetical protein